MHLDLDFFRFLYSQTIKKTIYLEYVPNLFDKVKRVPLSDWIDKNYTICPCEGFHGGKVVVVSGTEIANLEQNWISIH